MLINSSFINFQNIILEKIQQKTEKFTQNSVILSNLDNIIFFFIVLTLITSLWFPSDNIAIFAIVVIILTFIKLFFIKGQKISLSIWNSCLLIWLLISFLSVLTSVLIYKSFLGFFKTFIYIGFYFSSIQYFKYNKEKIKYIILLIAGLCCFETVIGLLQNKFGVIQGANWQDTSYVNSEDVLARVFGTLKPYNPNLYAGYLLCGLSSFIGLTLVSLTEKKYKYSIVATIFLLCSVLALFYSGCRGAYLGLGAMFFTLFAFLFLIFRKNIKENKKIQNLIKWCSAGFAVIVCLFFVLMPAITKRLMSIFVVRGDSSTSFRMNVYKSCIEMFSNNFLIGIGPGNKTFQDIYGLYMVSGFDALSSYNIYLEMAVESGIFALLAYLFFIVFLFFYIAKFLMSNILFKNKIIVLTAFISIIAILIHGFFDTIYFRPQVQFLFWTMVAIVTVLLVKEEEYV